MAKSGEYGGGERGRTDYWPSVFEHAELGPCMTRIGSRLATSNSVNISPDNVSGSAQRFVAFVFRWMAQFS
jgi:hypothetical protein